MLALLASCTADPPSIGLDPLPTDTGTPDTAQDTGPTEGVSARVSEVVGSLVYVSWDQPEAASVLVEYSFDEDEWRTTPTVEVAAPGTVELLLLGVPYDTDVRYRAVAGGTTSEEGVIRTDPLPDGLDAPTVLVADASAWDADSPYFVTSLNEPDTNLGGPWWTVILDRQGRVVWALAAQSRRLNIHPRVSRDGADLLLDQSSYWTLFDNGAQSQVVRAKIDGSTVATYDTPGMVHPFTDTADGAIVWPAVDGGSPYQTLEELADGEQRRLWDCGDLHRSIGASDTECRANTVNWRESTDSFLVSFFSSDSIVEVDRQSGVSLRWFGQIPQSYAFDPEDAAFWYQHGAHWTDAGTLLVSTHRAEDDRILVVREFVADDATDTLTEVWSFGEDEGVVGEQLGEAHRLPNGNTLHNYGTTPRLREVTPAGEVVWDVEWDGGGRYLGRSERIPDLYALAP